MMPIEIQSAWVQVIGGGVFAVFCVILGLFLGRQLEKRDRRQQKIIETGISPTTLVDPKRIGPLSVSVDKEFLTGNAADKGTDVSVSSAYSFIIGVSNVGIEDVEKPEIDITLNDKSSIVQIEVKSNSIPQDKIAIKKDTAKANYARISLPYINKDTNLSISILSINNENSECKLIVGGIGITHRKRTSSFQFSRNRTRDFLSHPIWFGVSAIVAIVSLIPAIIALFYTFAFNSPPPPVPIQSTVTPTITETPQSTKTIP